MPKRKILLSLFAVVAALGWASVAQSQGWPQRPVKILLPFVAGGSTDSVARVIAQRLSVAFGQQFIIENRAGASGAIAAEAVARSPADGYTLLMGAAGPITITPAASKTSYDPVRDFAPISNVGTNPLVLVVHPGVPVHTFAEFIDYARRQPNSVTFAGSGVGSMTHLAMALFAKRAGLEMVPVMYKGGGAAMTDVLAGHVDAYLANLSVTVPYAATGALRLLAVSSDMRAPQIPHVPTFIESGFPGFRAITWNGLLAPRGTPKEIVDRIAQEVSRAVKDPKIAEHLTASGIDPLGNSPDQFAAQIAADIALWAEAVKIAGAPEK